MKLRCTSPPKYNNRWFLFGYSRRKHDIVNLALDRILDVRFDERHPYVENTFFDPETYLGEMIGVTRDLDSKTETVTLRIVGRHAPYILTKPLHVSQRLVSKQPNGDIIITFTVILNHELENKILSPDPFAEVLAPAGLRSTIATQLLLASRLYQR